MNRIETVTLTNVIWGRQTSLLFALLLAALLMGSCASEPPAKPDIPDSISPGWKLVSFNRSAIPSGVPADGSPECREADYQGSGDAQAWICWYKSTANAFEAVQRARAEAQTVKFQEQHYFVLVKWNNVPKSNLTALVRAIQKALQPR